MSGYVPRHVGQAMDALGDRVGRYLFMPATQLAVTAADVLAWDRARGEPPLEGELSPEDEARLLAAAGRR